MLLGRNILKLTTSRTASAVVLFITTPVVARMFAPEHFGVQEVFIAIAAVSGIAACLRYELSIPLGRDDREASASFALSVTISLIFALILLLIVPFVRNQAAARLKSPELARYLWLVPLVVFMESLRRCLRSWAAYRTRFGIMAWDGLAKASIGGLTPILWYFIYGKSPAGLLAAIFTGGSVAILILSIPLFRSLVVGIRQGGLRAVVDVAWHHRRFPLYNIWSGLVNTLSARMPTFFLSLYFSKQVVGYYSLGERVINLPSILLGDSIKQVFYPAIGREYNETGDISETVRKTIRRLVQIGIFPMVAVGFCGTTLFRTIFGEQWVEAGVYAQILSVLVLSQFVTSPITAVFPVKSYLGRGLVYNIALATSRFIALFLASQTSNARLTLWAYSVTSSVVYALTLAWLLRLSGVPMWWGLKVMLKYTLGSAVLLLPVLFFVIRGYGIFMVAAGLVLATILYVGTLYKTDAGLQIAVNSMLSKSRRFLRQSA